MKNSLFIIIFYFILKSTVFLAQNSEGYWDYERAIEKHIPLEDGERKGTLVNLPKGTTQIIYRVSFLSENENITRTISSTLSSVPSEYAQGAAVAITLLDKFGGDNKGTYHIFLNGEDVQSYIDGNGVQNSCYDSESDIPGEKNYLIAGNAGCFSENINNLFFAFYNGNYVYDVKVVLEILPWIDYRSSSGWTLELKNEMTKNCIENYSEFLNPEDLCGCILDKLQENYKVQDFNYMTEIEINKIINSFSNICTEETGENNNQFNLLRDQAHEAASNNDFRTAIGNILTLVDEEVALSKDYNSLGWYYILTKQYLKAIKFLSEGEKLDNTDLMIQGNLAHANLLSGNFEAASQIYQRFKGQNIDEEMSWEQMVVSDFEEFKKRGINSEKFEEILSIIKE